MNKTIYTFWLGDEKRRNELIEYHKHINKIIYPWKIELGPTKDEHDFLMKNSNFYKRSYKEKIFSFCSDIYRLYKIYNYGGFYIDSGFKFNEKKIVDFLDKLVEKEFCFAFETPKYLLSGFFWSKNKNEVTFKKCLKYFEKISKKKDLHDLITCPIILSHYVFKNKGYLLEKNNDIMTLCSYEFDHDDLENIFYMYPTGSWHKQGVGKTNYKDEVWRCWKYSFNSFAKKYPYYQMYVYRKFRTSFLINKFGKYKIFSFLFLIVNKLLNY